ncbi:hypothetical protein ACH9DO_08200 [Kocuria sp. M1N1S27]|uniref:hypothetical protein n=1 Tax=Kocuria kalidii TaxID=3376283 RepID=UPI003798B128
MSDALTVTSDDLPDPSSPSGPPDGPPEAAIDPGPDSVDAFPPDLSRLSLVELHVWHSRISGQLSQDLADPAGPHPTTRDRHQELVAELDARGTWLRPPGDAT